MPDEAGVGKWVAGVAAAVVAGVAIAVITQALPHDTPSPGSSTLVSPSPTGRQLAEPELARAMLLDADMPTGYVRNASAYRDDVDPRRFDPTTGDADCVAIPDSVTGVGADVNSTYGVYTPNVDTADYIAERLVAFPTVARAAQAMSDFRTWLTQCHAATFHMDTFGPGAVSSSSLSIVPFGPHGDDAVAANQVIGWSEGEYQYLELIVVRIDQTQCILSISSEDAPPSSAQGDQLATVAAQRLIAIA